MVYNKYGPHCKVVHIRHTTSMHVPTLFYIISPLYMWNQVASWYLELIWISYSLSRWRVSYSVNGHVDSHFYLCSWSQHQTTYHSNIGVRLSTWTRHVFFLLINVYSEHCPRILSSITNRNPIVSKSNQLHVVFFQCFFINLRYIP